MKSREMNAAIVGIKLSIVGIGLSFILTAAPFILKNMTENARAIAETAVNGMMISMGIFLLILVTKIKSN